MSRPLHFGPMSRSLTVSYGYEGVPWTELDDILNALPKLLRLEFRGGRVFPDVPNLPSLSSHISPHLLELDSFPTTIGPGLLHLLDSLPNLRVWRNNAECIKHSSQLMLSPSLKRIEVFKAELVDDPLVFAHVLRHMTNLTHLTMSHCNFGPRRFLEAEERRRAILDAFSHCGTKLVSFTMEDSPAGSKERAPLTWILANIVPRMPNLQRLELLPGSEAYYAMAFDYKFKYNSDPAVQEIDSPDPTALISIDSDELSDFAMPSSLRFFTLVGSESMIGNYHRGSKIEGLSRAGWANANIIMPLFPSLPKFVYIERGALHVFGRFKNGICKYNGSRRWRHGWKDLDSDTLDACKLTFFVSSTLTIHHTRRLMPLSVH